MLCPTCKPRMGIASQEGAANDSCPGYCGARLDRGELAPILERTTPDARPTPRRAAGTATGGERQRDPDYIHLPEPTDLPRRRSGRLDRFGFG